MLSYCLKCKQITESRNPKVAKARNARIMFLSKFEVCDSKKSKSIIEEEASELLSTLGIKAPLNKTLLVGRLLF